MVASPPAVDVTLAASRALLEDAGAHFKYVGGVAVVHHGYFRTTENVDVLVDARSAASIAERAAVHGFVVESRARLRHVDAKVAVDLLVGGEPMPRPGSPRYPDPDALGASPRDPRFVGLAALCQLKLFSHRHRDLADIVELLGPLDDGRYLEVEAAVPATLRPELARLRDDVSRLLLPRARRALDLDRAYRAIVVSQSFARGREVVLTPNSQVYARVPLGEPTGVSLATTAD